MGQNSQNNRDDTIDIVRGAALVTMIFANLAGYILSEPHPLACRLFGTFAAPTFVLLSGMMVGRSTDEKQYPFGYFLRRGLLLAIATGLVLDLWILGLVPFVTTDILYLIAIAMPLTAALHKRFWLWRCVAIALVFGGTWLLQDTFGYWKWVSYFPLFYDDGTLQPIGDELKLFLGWPFLREVFIDGWFPVFPWVGFALLGSLFASLRWRSRLLADCSKGPVFLLAIAILLGGAAIWYRYPGPLYVRYGFSEMFYPPTLGFSITALGVVLCIFAAIDRNPHLFFYHPIRTMGRCSLAIYLLHFAIIERVILDRVEEVDLLEYFQWYAAVLAACIAVAYLVLLLKKIWKPMPFLLRFFLGG